MIALAHRAHPLVWAASTAVCGLLFLLGALSYRVSDREIPPGADALIQVQQVATSQAAALAALQDAADAHDVNLMLIGANPAGPAAPPWYFAFVGDRQLFDATFPGGNYPAFSPHVVPKIFPGTELTARDQPIRGTYALQGHHVDRFAIADSLSAAGFDVTTDSVTPTRNYLSGLFESVTWPALITAMVALALAIVYSAGLSRKASALQQFHGWRPARIVGQQAADLTVAYVAAAAAVVAVGVGVLLIYNRGHQLSQFLPWALWPMAAAGAIAVIVQLTASSAALCLPAHAAVRGARPVRLLSTTAGLSYVVMLALVFAVIVQATGAIVSIASDSRTFQNWDSERDSVVVQINPNAFESPSTNAFESDVAAAYASFGRVFNQLDADGTAVLSFHQTDRETGVSTAPLPSYEPLGGNSLIVNNNYLARHPIKDTSGNEITAVASTPGAIHLLIPEHLAQHADELAETYADTHLAAWDPIGHNEPVDPYTVTTQLIADDQAVFNYGNTWHMNNWVQTDPVVAVVSPESHYISNWILLGGAANNGNVIFTDATKFHQLADEAGLTERFSGINSPAANASRQLQERNTQAIIAVGNAVTGLLTLLIAVALLVAIYADSVRFASFLKRTHGWSAARIHAPFLVVTTSLSAAVIIVASILLRPAGLAAVSTTQTTAALMSGAVAIVIIAVTIALDRRAQAGLITRR